MNRRWPTHFLACAWLCWGALACGTPPAPTLDLLTCDGDKDCLAPRYRCCSGLCCVPGRNYICFEGGTACERNSPRGNYTCRPPCQQGTRYYLGGVWSKCEGQVLPQKERCNNIDDDCDGLVDEDFKDKDGDCFIGLGACRDKGIYRCADDGSGLVCKAKAAVGSAEVCGDSRDNDCDGQVDEGCTCQAGEQRLCGGGHGDCQPGIQLCASGRWPEAECKGEIKPKAESCDGRDNNCDGQVDEGCPCKDGDAQACYSGTFETLGRGLCKAGTQRCEKGQWSPCAGEVKPIQESCDNKKDDDCDGLVDEGCNCKGASVLSCYTGPGATRGVGACKDGTQSCASNQWQRCQGQVLPTVEVCNGKDDDCDGQLDNQLHSTQKLQKSCYEGPKGTQGLGQCKAGLQRCEQGKWGKCQGQVKPDTSIRRTFCDGKDYNCDGKPDENCCPKICQSNTDCDFCGGSFKCLRGTCTPVCPTGCQKDSECRNSACGTHVFCVQRTGGASKPCPGNGSSCSCGTDPCPTFCKGDKDCDAALCTTLQEGSRTACRNGRCVDPKICPSSCRSDGDCALPGCGNKSSCIGQQCRETLSPAQCDEISNNCQGHAECQQCGFRKCDFLNRECKK